jgi:hypothetical protein
MKVWAKALVASQILVSTFAFAHGPTPQKIDEKIVISAPVEDVWKKVSDFGSIADWHPMVESATSPEEGTRVLTLKDKEGTITESLDEKDDSKHYMGYRLLEENIEVMPVSYYGVSIQLDETDAGTEMTWEGRFYRADTGNFPPPEYSDEAAVKAMQDFATSGMEALKAELEGKK